MTLPTSEMPFVITSPFAEPTEFSAFRRQGHPVKVRTSTGNMGWLVSRHSDVAALCSDYRIGRSHLDPSRAARLWHAEIFPPFNNFRTELADHRRARQHLSRWYGQRNVESMIPRMRQILSRKLDELVRDRPPADLISQLVTPFVAQVVFEFVGIPPDDREKLQDWSCQIRARRSTPSTANRSALRHYLRGLLELKAYAPARDALSAAARSAASASKDSDTILDCISTFNLADYDVLAARLGYGLLFLLGNQAQQELLVNDRSLVPGAVQEILRIAVPGGSWIPRYALADIGYPAAPIQAGDLVVFAMQSANHDPEVFFEPARFDIARTPNQHVAFGRGKFYCLGAHLSVALLQVALDGIFERLPRLRLATEEICLRDQQVTGGLRTLQATWD
jgi:cytochrome P450 monooxygenase